MTPSVLSEVRRFFETSARSSAVNVVRAHREMSYRAVHRALKARTTSKILQAMLCDDLTALCSAGMTGLAESIGAEVIEEIKRRVAQVAEEMGCEGMLIESFIPKGGDR